MQNPRLSYADSMSRSHFKLMGFTVQFPVCSISAEDFKRFSLSFTQMFLSERRCAEPMTQLCRLKVKDTLQVIGLIIAFRVPVIYPEPFEIFPLIFTQMFLPLSEKVCRAYGSATQTQGQGHTVRSWDLPLNCMSAPYLLNHLTHFHLTSSKCSSH